MEGQSSTHPPTFMATTLSTVGPNILKDNTSHYCFTAPSGVPLPCHTLSISSCCHPKCFVSALSMEMKKGEQLPEADVLALAFRKPAFPFLAGFCLSPSLVLWTREHTTTETLLWSIGEILEKVHGKWKMEIINATLPRKVEDRTLYVSSL